MKITKLFSCIMGKFIVVFHVGDSNEVLVYDTLFSKSHKVAVQSEVYEHIKNSEISHRVAKSLLLKIVDLECDTSNCSAKEWEIVSVYEFDYNGKSAIFDFNHDPKIILDNSRYEMPNLEVLNSIREGCLSASYILPVLTGVLKSMDL